jgi:putative endonuclease
MTNKWNTVLYTGMSGRIEERITEHKDKVVPSFTARYHINKLVYVEEFGSSAEAAEAEWRIKKWSRAKKKALIESQNPQWEDLGRILE